MTGIGTLRPVDWLREVGPIGEEPTDVRGCPLNRLELGPGRTEQSSAADRLEYVCPSVDRLDSFDDAPPQERSAARGAYFESRLASLAVQPIGDLADCRPIEVAGHLYIVLGERPRKRVRMPDLARRGVETKPFLRRTTGRAESQQPSRGMRLRTNPKTSLPMKLNQTCPHMNAAC